MFFWRNCLLLELKSVQEILPIHKAQLMSYMKLLNAPIGLLINFYEVKLTDGIHRLILPGANREDFAPVPSFASLPSVQIHPRRNL